MIASSSFPLVPIAVFARVWTSGQTQAASRVFFVNFARRRPVRHGFGKLRLCVRSVNFDFIAGLGRASHMRDPKPQKRVRSVNLALGTGLLTSRPAHAPKPHKRVRSVNLARKTGIPRMVTRPFGIGRHGYPSTVFQTVPLPKWGLGRNSIEQQTSVRSVNPPKSRGTCFATPAPKTPAKNHSLPIALFRPWRCA